ncbi:hypothetical protein BDP27DRAFT_812537 [Rhodocollybia butyracea]|uniref:Uncharacterized protein n=1 Tax=Rhodocollybia butyracea TaxID=206335 RepID=A0A9P5Q8H6_9AGAR|nr:hypothetical protein BDP27DRAFT_812537 [Rhodocollybia butyracea]
MSPEMRIKKNFSIESANNARYVKTYDHSVGETSRPGSPTASFMTVASADLQRIRKDQGLLKSLADFLGPWARNWLKGKEEEDAEARRNNGKDNRAPKRLKLAADVVEILDDPTARPMVQFPDTLICTANLSSSLPLCLFTLPHLQTIYAFQNEIKTKKTYIPDDEGKIISVGIYDIAKLRERLGIAADTGKSDGLTFSQFRDAAQNFYNFEAERTEGHGQSIRAQWTSSHFMFFLNQPDAEELYSHWKPIEYDLRLQHQLRSLSFNIEIYRGSWLKAELARDIQRTQDAATASANSADSLIF